MISASLRSQRNTNWMNIVEVNTGKRSMRVHPVGIDMVGDLPLKHILKYAISEVKKKQKNTESKHFFKTL